MEIHVTDTQFSFTVRAPELGRQGTFTATVTVEVTPQTARAALHYIRSLQLKSDFMNGWVKDNAPTYGIEIRGGPRPVFETAGDRSTPVVAYEQDFRLTRAV